jgi:two-component system, response regulator
MQDKIILLVEDNANDEYLTLRMLKKHRLENRVVIAHDGVEALDYLRGTGNHAGRDVSVLPELVLLDLHMPKLNGFEVLRSIREDNRTKQLPVLMLTGSEYDEHRIELEILGVQAYLRKPLETEAFAEATRRIGLHWLLVA